MNWKKCQVDKNRNFYKLNTNKFHATLSKVKHERNWFLQCRDLNIINCYLRTEDLTKAQNKAKNIITKRIKDLEEVRQEITGKSFNVSILSRSKDSLRANGNKDILVLDVEGRPLMYMQDNDSEGNKLQENYKDIYKLGDVIKEAYKAGRECKRLNIEIRELDL